MSQFCPLCGKPKPESTLFCDDCSKKIQVEYEVELPDEINKNEDDGFVEPADSSSYEPTPTKKRRRGAPIVLLLLVGLLVGAYFVYDVTVHKSNLDLRNWEAAVKANSVEGYLEYMISQPQGAHFDEAEAGLHRLKSEEASSWERMKETDNASELRDFLAYNADSRYASLIRARLDSLIWIGTLQTNTASAYEEYIRLTQTNEIVGGYLAEAQTRVDLLMSRQEVDEVLMDSIRASIGAFFVAYSSNDHAGLERCMAPTVYRFFQSGAATSEEIIGRLLVTSARSEDAMQITPDLSSLRYESASNNRYKVNVPFRKLSVKDGLNEEVHGYIAHIELNLMFELVTIYETKPFPDAP